MMGQEAANRQPEGIHIVAKPIGPRCNLNCEYCFYLEKEALYPEAESFRMPDEVLSAYITRYISAQPTPVVELVWQGGEPTLLGVDFFRRVVQLQEPFKRHKTIVNSLQTNGTLLDGQWCEFLKENNFLVGLSLDGPREIHDRYRRDRNGEGTFDKVMRGLRLLQRHKVDYNIMACVARETAYKPLEVYHFFKEQGVEFIQFTPIVERMPGAAETECGLQLAGPAAMDGSEANTQVTEWSVEPEQYGDFLIAIYEEWVRNDVGSVFVMNFEWALNSWLGNEPGVCVFAKQCGRSLVLEHNGDVYACDHSVYPQYKLGNILEDDPVVMAEKSTASGFGVSKETALPRQCLECSVLVGCRGGCPKHRFGRTYYDEPDLQYLCEGYRKFFLHIHKYCHAMTQLLANGYSACDVMKACRGPLAIMEQQS